MRRCASLTLLTVLFLCGALSGCGSDSDDRTTATSQQVSQSSPDESGASAVTGTPAQAEETPEISEAVSYLGSYVLADPEFGTQTTVTVQGPTRTIVSNAIPDHETGNFPNDGNPHTISPQSLVYEFTTEPVFQGSESPVRIPGVAINGVKFEPETAETVTCGSGEVYRVEALQNTYNLGLDFNNAHVQPTGEYHYHGVAQLLADGYSSESDLVHLGFAADGFLMYYSKSGAFKTGYELSQEVRVGTSCVGSSSLRVDAVEVAGTTPDGTFTSDWVWNEEISDLDRCNGTYIDGTYVYLITDEFPFISRCLNGEFVETRASGGGASQGRDS